MTTAHSPLSALKTQADKIATMLKAFERGEKIDVRFAEKIAASRDKEEIKIGIVMDDKVITIDIPWTAIRVASEAEMSGFIVEQMLKTR